MNIDYKNIVIVV